MGAGPSHYYWDATAIGLRFTNVAALQGAAVCNRRPIKPAISNRRSLMLFAGARASLFSLPAQETPFRPHLAVPAEFAPAISQPRARRLQIRGGGQSR